MRAPAGVGCLFNDQRANGSRYIPQGDNANRNPLATALSGLISRTLEIHLTVSEVLSFWIKTSVHGSARGDSWRYLESRVLCHTWICSSRWGGNSGYSAYCRWVFFLMLLLFCKKNILKNSCWSGLGWRWQNGLADRVRTLHHPCSALLPATCAAFCSLLVDKHSALLKVSFHTRCRSVVSWCLLFLLNHVLLSFNILIDVLG